MAIGLFANIPYLLKFFLYYKNKSLTAIVRLSKSLYGFYLIISNIVAMSSVAIVTFDFSIKMFPPVIMYEGITPVSYTHLPFRSLYLSGQVLHLDKESDARERRRSIGQIRYIRYMGSRWADTR